jgi:uncharacterized membrane protein
MLVGLAAALCRIVEDAVAVAVSQSGVPLLVVTHKLLPVMTGFFQKLNVRVGKQHFCFGAADSAM